MFQGKAGEGEEGNGPEDEEEENGQQNNLPLFDSVRRPQILPIPAVVRAEEGILKDRRGEKPVCICQSRVSKTDRHGALTRTIFRRYREE